MITKEDQILKNQIAIMQVLSVLLAIKDFKGSMSYCALIKAGVDTVDLVGGCCD